MPGRQLLTKPLAKSGKPPLKLLALETLDIQKDAEAPVATVTLPSHTLSHRTSLT